MVRVEDCRASAPGSREKREPKFKYLSNNGVLSIIPNRPVRDQWEYPRNMERHFSIKPGQPIGMALTNF